MAYWNGMIWECSPSVITYLESLSTSYSMKTDTNADKEGNAPTKQVALSDEEISLSTTYRVETGTSNIKEIIGQWKSMIGLAAPLIIGSEVFGPDNVQLQSVSVGSVSMRPDGTFTAAVLSFKFKEFREEIIEIDSGKGAGTGSTGNVISSAVSVRANKTERAARKRQIQYLNTNANTAFKSLRPNLKGSDNI